MKSTSAVLFPVGLWTALIALALAARPLLPVDETRYLAVAWEMWQRGDFLVPYLNGEPYSHKPPLLFWGMHLGWAVFGVNEWTPRLVAPLFGLATVLGMVRLGRLLWPDRPEVGSVAAALVMGALYWTLFTTMTMFDMLHAACTVAGIVGLVTAARGRMLRGFLMFAAAAGVGILGKGPAILLHLLPAALAAPWWAPALCGPTPWRQWYIGVAVGVLVGAAIGLAWAIPAAMAGGEAYANAIFWGQSAGRMVDSFAHGRPFWWFAAILPGMVLPWMVWPAAWRAVRWQWRKMGADGGVRLVLVWFVAAFAVFSAISGKQPHYLVPEFPALALLLARALADKEFDADFWRVVDRWVPAGLAALITAVLAAAFAFDLKPSWATSAGDATMWPLAMMAGVILLYFVQPGITLPGRVWRMAALSVSLIIGIHLVLRPLMDESHNFRPFAQKLKSFEDQGYDFVTFGKYHGQFHFLGRLTRPFGIADGPKALESWLKDHPKAMIVALHKGLPDGPAPAAATRFRSRMIGVWEAGLYPPRVDRLGRQER
ncbi:MAG: glycosyltransferase family 39 protein [Rhodospirillales bacterium]